MELAARTENSAAFELLLQCKEVEISESTFYYLVHYDHKKLAYLMSCSNVSEERYKSVSQETLHGMGKV